MGEDATTKQCCEPCCSPKRFGDIWWGIWSCLAVLQIVGCFVGDMTLSRWITTIWNVLVVFAFIMSVCQPEKLGYRSFLSYVSDFTFAVSCIMWVVSIIIMFVAGGAACSAGGDMMDDWANDYADWSVEMEDAYAEAGMDV